MKFDFKFITVLLVALAALGLSLFTPQKQKIAYVRSAELVNKYAGMLEAKNEYKKKSDAWKANIDTLRLDFEKSVRKYQDEAPKLSEAEKKEREQKLGRMQESFTNYSKTIEAKEEEEDAKMTDAVLAQVNSFVEEWGRDHNYDVILGTTTTGNVLYGNKALDITDELLHALNKHYKGDK